MVGNYKVITVCGSTRFKDEFMEAQKKLTLEGNIVISVGLFGHSGDTLWKIAPFNYPDCEEERRFGFRMSVATEYRPHSRTGRLSDKRAYRRNAVNTGFHVTSYRDNYRSGRIKDSVLLEIKTPYLIQFKVA